MVGVSSTERMCFYAHSHACWGGSVCIHLSLRKPRISFLQHFCTASEIQSGSVFNRQSLEIHVPQRVWVKCCFCFACLVKLPWFSCEKYRITVHHVLLTGEHGAARDFSLQSVFVSSNVASTLLCRKGVNE